MEVSKMRTWKLNYTLGFTIIESTLLRSLTHLGRIFKNNNIITIRKCTLKKLTTNLFPQRLGSSFAFRTKDAIKSRKILVEKNPAGIQKKRLKIVY